MLLKLLNKKSLTSKQIKKLKMLKLLILNLKKFSFKKKMKWLQLSTEIFKTIKDN